MSCLYYITESLNCCIMYVWNVFYAAFMHHWLEMDALTLRYKRCRFSLLLSMAMTQILRIKLFLLLGVHRVIRRGLIGLTLVGMLRRMVVSFFFGCWIFVNIDRVFIIWTRTGGCCAVNHWPTTTTFKIYTWKIKREEQLTTKKAHGYRNKVLTNQVYKLHKYYSMSVR